MHTENKKHKKILPIAIGSLVLAACGGGGSSSNGYTGPTTALTITQGNADTTVAYAAAVADSKPGNITSVLLAGVAGRRDKLRPDLVKLTRRLLEQSLNHTQTASLLAGVSATETTPCTTGSITATSEFAQSDSDTPGDSVSFTYNNCLDDWWGWTYNGQMSVAIDTVQGDAVNEIPPWNLTATVTMNNFKVSDDPQYVLMNGSYSFGNGEDSNGVQISTISGASFTTKDNTDQSLLTDFTFYEAYDGATQETTDSWGFTVASTEIGGRVTVDTTTDFKTTATDNYPYAGVATITGKDGSKVQITAQSDATSVQLEYDYDGDGTWDDTQLKTWSELELLI